MLDIDTPAIGTLQIPHQLFIRRRIGERVFAHYLQKPLNFWLEPCLLYLLGIFEGLLGKVYLVLHHSGSL